MGQPPFSRTSNPPLAPHRLRWTNDATDTRKGFKIQISGRLGAARNILEQPSRRLRARPTGSTPEADGPRWAPAGTRRFQGQDGGAIAAICQSATSKENGGIN